MSFLVDLFNSEKKGKSVVLIDINTSSVAGAYVYYGEEALPVVLYTRRLPIETHSRESEEKAMARALQILGDTLIREGAPLLAQTTGSGSADAIIVAIGSLWQTTSVRTETFEEEQPFVFTRSLVTAKLETTAVTAEGKALVDESIIGTILNGYETRDPYGKEARRASVIVLTSSIDEHVAESVVSILRGVFHSKHIQPIASPSLRFQAIQSAFPHERDALIVDAIEPFTSIALVRRGLIVSTSRIEVPTTAAHLSDEFAELARQYPLPRTIFLLAHETETQALQKALGSTNLGELWLSDNPPRIVSVLASHVVPLVRQTTSAPPDLSLLLMAVYSQHAALVDTM